MHYLYGQKAGDSAKQLVATFDTQEQLLAYVRWATLQDLGNRRGKYEQGSALAGYQSWDSSTAAPSGVDADSVDHNPTPSML